MKAPFPAFGGKSRAVPIVWPRFGHVVNYIEPFAFSAAMLLGCPASQCPRVETINDVNGFVSNFWRAVKAAPEAVASVADYPVIETDLHARHRWLLAQAADLRTRLDADPDYFDAQIAGWWVWGASAWIGSGWCEEGATPHRKTPDLGGSRPDTTPQVGHGIHAKGMREPSRKLPDLGGSVDTTGPTANFGRGIHAAGARAPRAHVRQLPEVSTAGMGINGVAARGPSRQLPDIGARSEESHGGRGVHRASARTALYDIFAALHDRLRYVRVACGDWARICTPAVTYRHGLTAVFLDPPYDGFEHLYGATEEHAEPLSARVRAWALEMGERPDMRIALCGYEGEHDMPAAWECVAWKAKGGYGNQREDGENENAARERIWFSPHCLRPGVNVGQLDMLARLGGAR